MKSFVVDASVAVKWFSRLKEDDLAKADQLLQMHAEGRAKLLAPTLIAYEISNAMRFNPRLSAADVRAAMSSFFALDISLIAPVDHLGAAIELSFKFSLTVYDAVYAALAQVSGIPLVTADYRFFEKAKDLPFVEALRDLGI
jgi:predicted nucleic acid-binding protein